MTATEVVEELRSLGSESIKKVLVKHGAREPFFGVKAEHLKKLHKKIGVNYALALELFDTGISDAMYLAGLIADDARMSKKDLQRWVNAAYWYYLSEYAVPWVAAGSKHGRELALKWIESKKENVASSGWSTFSSMVGTTPDEQLDLKELAKLLDRVAKTIHDQPNRVRHVMNGFVIAVGSFVTPLTEAALKTAKAIGKVSVNMGETSCQVPSAAEYIQKTRARTGGKKRKNAKCL